MSFLSLLSLTGDILALGGAAGRLLRNPERREVEGYIGFLELRKVLYAQIDQEIKDAVIVSIEEIKRETEKLRVALRDKESRSILARLIKVMSDELVNIHAFDTLRRPGQMKMFMSLQRFRTEMARTLAKLCHSYGIDPASTELQEFIVNMATVRPLRA